MFVIEGHSAIKRDDSPGWSLLLATKIVRDLTTGSIRRLTGGISILAI